MSKIVFNKGEYIVMNRSFFLIVFAICLLAGAVIGMLMMTQQDENVLYAKSVNQKIITNLD